MSSADERLEQACALWLTTGDLAEVERRYPDVAAEVAILARTRQEVEGLARTHGAGLPMPEVPGYRLLRPLGRGAFAVVYEAEQLSLRRRVALKVLSPVPFPDPSAAERFRREAIAAASLRHPAIVAVYDHGEAAGTFFIAMELCGEQSLAEQIARQRNQDPQGVPARTTAEFAELARRFAALADALEHAHARDVLHRDLKPANVLVAQDGSLRLLDFGLARLLGGESLTLSGQPIGSPQTMAPEQARGDRSAVGPWSDVYGLGATLYEALTGQPVYPGGALAEVVAQVLAGRARPPRSINPAIPAGLAAIVTRCLEHDPRMRYADAATLAADLRAFADGMPVTAQRARLMARTASLVRRRPLAMAAALAATVALLVLVQVWQRTRVAEAGREHAESRSLVMEQRLMARAFQDRVLDLLNRVYRLGGGSGRPNIEAELDTLGLERAALHGDPETEALFAYALWTLGRNEDAAAVLDDSPAAAARAEGQLLRIHLGTGGVDAAALALWRNAQDRGIDTPIACYLAGQYLLRCDAIGAIEHFERGRAHASIGMHFFISIHQSLVEARTRVGLLEDALRDARTVQGTQGDDPRTLACLASLLTRLGRDAMAAPLREQIESALERREALRPVVCQLLLNVEDVAAAAALLGSPAAGERGAAAFRVGLECRLQGPPASDEAEFVRKAVRHAHGDPRVPMAAARLLLQRRDAACLKLLDRAPALRVLAAGLLEGSADEAQLVADGRERGASDADLARQLALWRLLRERPDAEVEPLLLRASEHFPLPPLPLVRADAEDGARGDAVASLGVVDVERIPAAERARRNFGVLELLVRNGNRFPAVVAAHARAQQRVR